MNKRNVEFIKYWVIGAFLYSMVNGIMLLKILSILEKW